MFQKKFYDIFNGCLMTECNVRKFRNIFQSAPPNLMIRNMCGKFPIVDLRDQWE